MDTFTEKQPFKRLWVQYKDHNNNNNNKRGRRRRRRSSNVKVTSNGPVKAEQIITC